MLICGRTKGKAEYMHYTKLNGILREALRVQSDDENETIKKVLCLDDEKIWF